MTSCLVLAGQAAARLATHSRTLRQAVPICVSVVASAESCTLTACTMLVCGMQPYCQSKFLLPCRRSLSDTAAARQQHETLRRLSDDATTLQRLSNSSQVHCLTTACQRGRSRPFNSWQALESVTDQHYPVNRHANISCSCQSLATTPRRCPR